MGRERARADGSRQVDLEDYLEIPAFLRVENHPPDLAERTAVRRRAWREHQPAARTAEEPRRRQVARRLPEDFTE